jgi:phosphatidylglycerol lysyltransferase
MMLLAFVAPGDFFPAAWNRWAWVGFDAVVAAGMLRLARRLSPRLALALALSVTADALITVAQAVFWNFPRGVGLAAGALVSIACAAPAFAAVTLWGALARARKLR